MILKRKGHEIWTAENGEIALKRMEEKWRVSGKGFDLVLSIKLRFLFFFLLAHYHLHHRQSFLFFLQNIVMRFIPSEAKVGRISSLLCMFTLKPFSLKTRRVPIRRDLLCCGITIGQYNDGEAIYRLQCHLQLLGKSRLL